MVTLTFLGLESPRNDDPTRVTFKVAAAKLERNTECIKEDKAKLLQGKT